jgi:predicted small secreted protein
MKAFADIIMLLLYVALAATLVAHANTATDINAAGNAFSTSLKTAVTG